MRRPFASRLFLVSASLAVLTPPPSTEATPPELDAHEVLAEVNSHLHFPDSIATLEMVVFKGDRPQKTYVMRTLKKDSERIRIEFLQPNREKGRELLRVGDKMWMYLPDLGKSIVISARQSFLGSTFSNGDLLRTDLVADYEPAFLAEPPAGSEGRYVLELLAKSRQVTYDRIVLSAERDSLLPTREELYTRSGKLLKVLQFSEPGTLGGIRLATEMRIESTLRKDEATVIRILDFEAGRDLPPALFDKSTLGRP